LNFEERERGSGTKLLFSEWAVKKPFSKNEVYGKIMKLIVLVVGNTAKEGKECVCLQVDCFIFEAL
jgi:hypothetical protein